MSFCLHCGKQLPDDAKFCSECGTPVGSAKTGYESNRQQVYAGKVIKCPSCGTEIPSFTAICPGCGHEINSSRVSESLNAFVEKLDELDRRISSVPKAAKEGWASWKAGQRFWWIVLNIFTYCIPLVIYLILPLMKFNRTPKLTPEEEQKASFIENYAFANEREAILEALLFVESKVSFIATQHVDRKVMYWARLWSTKGKQLYKKADLLLKGEKAAEDAYENILSHTKAIRQAYRKPLRTGGYILITSGVLMIASYLFVVSPFIKTGGFSSIGGNKPFLGIFYKWPVEGIGSLLPKPSSIRGTIIENSNIAFRAEIDGISDREFDDYVGACREDGFYVCSEYGYIGKNPIDDSSVWIDYSAYNAEGYYLVLTDSFDMEITLVAPGTSSEIAWEELFLMEVLPIPESNAGNIETNSEEEMTVHVANISANQYADYINACKEHGFTLDVTTRNDTFEAFLADGHKLNLEYEEGRRTMSVEVEAPMPLETLQWPKKGIAKLLPKPEATTGKIRSHDSDYFSVYVGETSRDVFEAYINQCLDEGFDRDYHMSETSFYGDNKKGYHVSVTYEGGNVMYISIDAPDD